MFSALPVKTFFMLLHSFSFQAKNAFCNATMHHNQRILFKSKERKYGIAAERRKKMHLNKCIYKQKVYAEYLHFITHCET
jgi:CRISPR/Cas system CMR-associated protein Cmr3 (group 5 of RAMP superfamily)